MKAAQKELQKHQPHEISVDTKIKRVFHVTGRTEAGDLYDVTAAYVDGFDAINAAIDAGAVGAVARPMGVLQ